MNLGLSVVKTHDQKPSREKERTTRARATLVTCLFRPTAPTGPCTVAGRDGRGATPTRRALDRSTVTVVGQVWVVHTPVASPIKERDPLVCCVKLNMELLCREAEDVCRPAWTVYRASFPPSRREAGHSFRVSSYKDDFGLSSRPRVAGRTYVVRDSCP